MVGARGEDGGRHVSEEDPEPEAGRKAKTWQAETEVASKDFSTLGANDWSCRQDRMVTVSGRG